MTAPEPVPSGTADDLQPCTTPECDHLGVQHDIGTRRGTSVRTACSTTTGTTPCPCTRFTPREES